MNSPSRYHFPNGLPFDAISYEAAIARVLELSRVKSHAGFAVYTPNVHHYYIFNSQPDFRTAYEAADLVLLDGMPLVWSARVLLGIRTEKISGSDIFFDLLCRAVSEQLRVFLLGGAPGIAERAVERTGFGHLIGSQVFCHSPPLGFDSSLGENRKVIELISEAKPNILFVGLGAPRQELWIDRHRNEIGAGVSLGVGGSFDFAAGRIPRAPRWMQRTSLEWLYRLSREPGRLWQRYLRTNTHFVAQMAHFLVQRQFGKR